MSEIKPTSKQPPKNKSLTKGEEEKKEEKKYYGLGVWQLRILKVFLIFLTVFMFIIFDEKLFSPDWSWEYRFQFFFILFGFFAFYQFSKRVNWLK